ncbi:oligosaccharide flippase family protein [Pseudoalteromonas sp. NZS11]|uniref:oligosaccharide flippase family protein n=1 Tax=Pseudoalteromonas sp. NZS11 TaxID=2792049 RepID=UPI0018CEE62F|nr:oligosaccharide flippase family protein [Pseudoalteromonas sp. NZS11]MBH0078186.1 oligosaccharide flippase family protein [Pseudoalteromonas sp. NZS11]
MTALSSKLFILFYFANVLSPEEFISYGIITVTIAYLQYIVGLDIYNYANREVALSSNKYSLLKIVSKQYSFYFFVYFFVFLLISIIALFNEIVPFFIGESLFLLGGVLITEHYFNECYRMWVFKSRPIFSAFLYFIKSVVFLAAVFTFNYLSSDLGIHQVLLLWFVSNLTAILISTFRFNIFYVVYRLYCMDYVWVKKAIKFSYPLVLSALCSKAIFTFDRSLAGGLLEIKTAATYVLLMSIFFAVNSLLDSVFFVFKAPILIKSSKGNFRAVFTGFLRTGGGISFFCALLFVPSFYASMIVFPDKVSATDLHIFVLAGGVFLLFNISQIYHYGLYALGASKKIFSTQLFSLVFCACFFLSGFAMNLTSSIEFFFLSLGVYCCCVLLLKRRALMSLEENK